MSEWLVAVVVGLLQGILEWLPVSSEGSVALALTLLDRPADAATRYALFLHLGTAVAAATYYSADLVAELRRVPDWNPSSAFEGNNANITFWGVATLVSGVVGVGGYLVLEEIATAIAGGAFVAVIGGLLLVTGLFMRTAETRAVAPRESPGPLDAVVVGVLQGLAVLPGVSRSGTTVSALLLRGHDGEESLRLSFVLSVPAAAGAGLLVFLDEGIPAISPGVAVVAIAVSAVVGYLTVDALVRVVRRVAFWKVCVGFGALAVLGGAMLLV
ncbi:undecaprenyl-diphosphate phosphatase [Halobacteriales archaeon Cl-PHB]